MTDPDALLAALDPQQRAAAEALVGPVAILAGAGTGKTRTITHRIAYGIATGRYSGPRTMALTFTRRAGEELRSRLRSLGVPEVQARTFHAAALAQLSHFWPQVVGGRMPRIVEAKGPLIADAARAERLPADPATVRDVAAEIEWRKVSNLSIDEWAASGRRVGGLRIEQVAAMQRAYEDLKDERQQIDLEDVLLATAGMLAAEPGIARVVREQYRTFVVDEYQDVSPIQHRLLRLWLGDRKDLCVVGDANQTIYTFAGASPKHLLGFAQEFPGAQVHRLERSHRSTQPILDVANRLMRGRPGALSLTAVAAPDSAAPVPEVHAYRTDAEERAALVEAVRADLASGIPPHRIAVLIRLNAQAPELDAALRGAGFAVSLRGDARFYTQPHVREAIVHLIVARRGAPADASPAATVRGVLSGLGWSLVPPGDGETAAVRERWHALDALHRLALDAEGESYAAFIDALLERQAANDDPVAGSVAIATMHSAKGLEWDSVHVIGLAEGLLPISYASDEVEIEEERRLLYVAVTRAKQRLRLSWSARQHQRAAERAPSRFLAELGR